MIYLCAASQDRRRILDQWLRREKVPLLPPEEGATVEQQVARASRILIWYDADFQRNDACLRALRAAWIPAAAHDQLAERIHFVLPTEILDPRSLHPEGQSRPELDLLFFPEPTSEEGWASLAGGLVARPPLSPFGSLSLPQVPRYGGTLETAHLFIGRDRELWQLHGLLLESRQVAVTGRDRPLPVYLTGMGGTGKSRLVQEYARIFASAWPGGIYDVGRGEEDRRLGLCDELGIAEGPIEGREASLRETLEKGPPYLWLLDDPPEGLEGRLAPTANGSSLISRRKATGLGRSLELEGLGAEDALKLLGEIGEKHREIARQLCARLGGLPLAMEVLGALLRSERGADGEQLWERLGEEVERAPADDAGAPSGLWPVLRRGIERLGEGAGDLLLLATLVEAAPIPKILAMELLQEVDGLEEEEAEESLWISIDEAMVLALLQTEATFFRVHALIRLMVGREAKRPARLQALEAALPAVLLRLLSLPSPRAIPKFVWLRPLLPHARQQAQSLERPEHRRLLQRLAELDLEQGRYRAAIGSWERLLPDSKDDERIRILQNLAEAVGAAGDWRRAQHLAEQTLPLLAGKARGAPERLRTEHILSTTLYHLGDQKAAQKQEKELLDLRVQSLGLAHPDSQATLQNLSLSRLALGEAEAAVVQLRTLYHEAERQLGASHPETLLRLHNLAFALHAAGETTEALRLGLGAWEGRKVALGAEHPLSLSSLHNCACFRQALGDFSGAIDAYTECFRLSEEVLGPEHPQSLGTAQNLAASLQARGDLVAARRLFEKVLEARTRILGSDHPDRLMTLQNLGVLLLELGQPGEARPRLEEALRLRVQSQGPEHPDSYMTLQNLGSCLVQLGEIDAAKTMIEDALAGFQRLYGPKHPLSLSCLANLGNLQYISGDLAEARRLFEEALADLELLYPPLHPDRLRLLQNLGNVRAGQGDLAGSRRLYEKALSGYQQSLPESHPERLRLEQNLGSLCLVEGKREEARAIFEKVYALRRATLGAEHPQTVNTGRSLAGQFACALLSIHAMTCN